MSSNIEMNSVNDLNSRPTIRIHPSSERTTDSVPLLVHESTNTPNEKPPLANPEMDDLDDDKTEHDSTTPYFGIDDGLFDKPETNHIPDIGFRAAAGTDDETDGLKPNSTPSNRHSPVPGKPGTFPYAPSFGHDLEVGTIPGDFESIPDINVYQHKKTLAQGMMDLALFSANANQLRYVIESFNRHPYYYPSLILISFSLLLQVAIGIGLIWNAIYNVKDDKEICLANKINNFTVIGIFLVTVINVFISAFGVADMSAAPVTGT